MAQVLGHGLHRLSGVYENRRVEVPEGVHAVGSAWFDAGGEKCWPPDVGVEVVPVERLVFPAREHELPGPCRELAKVLGQLDGGRLRQGDHAGPAALRWAGDELATNDLDLLFHPDPATQEVDTDGPKPDAQQYL